MNYRVGQKVVCVDDKQTHANPTVRHLEEGRTYTVRWVGAAEDFNWCVHPMAYPSRGCAIRVVGVVREIPDKPFCAARFRPLVTRKTSIEIFQKLLNPTPQKVTV